MQTCTVATTPPSAACAWIPRARSSSRPRPSAGTLGFRLYATDDRTGPPRRVLLTEQPILVAGAELQHADPVPRGHGSPSPRPTSSSRRSSGTASGAASAPSRSATSACAWASSASRNGTRQRDGSDRAGSAPPDVAAARGLARAVTRPHARGAWPGRASKIEGRAGRPVHVASPLVAAGMPAGLHGARPRALRLTNLGRPVPSA